MASPTDTSKTGLLCFDWPGYDNHGLISAAVVIPPNRRIVTTSGMLALDKNGKHPDSLEEEFVISFDKIEKSLQAVAPNLSSEELWASVYQVNTFHAGGMNKEVFGLLTKVALRYTRGHKPSWTAVEVVSLNGGCRFEIHVQAALAESETNRVPAL